MPALTNAHALVVGIANYQYVNPLPPVVLADAQAVRDVLVDESLCAYSPDNVTLLLDGAATLTGIRRALAELAARTDGDSTVFLYVSSHGGRLETGAAASSYLLPVDALSTSAAALMESALAGSEFTRALAAIPARKLVVVLDCCHAGSIGEPKDAAPELMTGLADAYLETLKGGRGRVILASSRSSELSWVLPNTANSLFTTYLLRGLQGEANGAGGVIRIFDLFDYLQPRVVAAKSQQHPIFKAEVEENFPIALYRGGQKSTATADVIRDDGYEHDLFISYSGTPEDRSWVRNHLLPSLDERKLRVAVDFRAPLGMPMILFSERAVQCSRYTVAVLTEAYLASGFGEFENLVAQYLGIEQGAYRLLPVMAQLCTPRLGLRMLPLLDLSGSEEWAANLERLMDQMHRPPEPRAGATHMA